MANFKNATSSGIGTTEAIVYTATTKSIVIGCNISNIYGSIVPVDLILRKDNTDTCIKKQLRIPNGESVEIMKGNKIVLSQGESIVAKGYVDNSIDIILSLLTGVT